jgi:large subunit ribosomal protein L1
LICERRRRVPRHSRRYQEIRQKVDRTRFYSVDDAIELVKQTATAKFDETVELHLSTNIDTKRPEQQVRSTVTLPHGTGKRVRVLVFAKGDKAEAAKNAGADYVGGDELVEKITNENFTDFDVAIATPDMMRSIGKLGKILGPRGLMPSPKSGTVTEDVETAVKAFKMGRIEVRNDKTGCIHIPVGKCSFDGEKLRENLLSAYRQIIALRPAGVKGQFIKRVVLSSTMGVGIKIDQSDLENI